MYKKYLFAYFITSVLSLSYGNNAAKKFFSDIKEILAGNPSENLEENKEVILEKFKNLKQTKNPHLNQETKLTDMKAVIDLLESVESDLKENKKDALNPIISPAAGMKFKKKPETQLPFLKSYLSLLKDELDVEIENQAQAKLLEEEKQKQKELEYKEFAKNQALEFEKEKNNTQKQSKEDNTPKPIAEARDNFFQEMNRILEQNFDFESLVQNSQKLQAVFNGLNPDIQTNIIKTLVKFKENKVDNEVLSDLQKLVSKNLGPKAPKSFFSQYIKVLTEDHPELTKLRPDLKKIEHLEELLEAKKGRNDYRFLYLPEYGYVGGYRR